MPTRLVHGLSFVRPSANSGGYTFTVGDQTPDVSLGTFFVTAPSSLTILNFDGGERGKVIYLYSNSASSTTLQNSAGGINVFATVATIQGTSTLLAYSTTGNYVMGNREVLQFVHNGTDWSQVSPSIRI